jgi:hypothetical protein
MAKRSRKKRAAFGGAADDVPAKSAESDVVAQQKAARWGRDWLWGLILFLAVFVTYLPVWRAGYVWGDALFITEYPVIVGPLGLKEIWTTSASD